TLRNSVARPYSSASQTSSSLRKVIAAMSGTALNAASSGRCPDDSELELPLLLQPPRQAKPMVAQHSDCPHATPLFIFYSASSKRCFGRRTPRIPHRPPHGF